MAEEDKKPRSQRGEPWVIRQARDAVKSAEEAVKNPPIGVSKEQARQELKAAQDRLRSLLRSTRRDTQTDRRLAEAQAAVDAAVATPGTADDEQAQARVEQLTGRAEQTEERKRESRQQATDYFYSEMGPLIAEAVKEFPQLRAFFQQALAGKWNAEKQDRELRNPEQPWYDWWQKRGTYWQQGFARQFRASTAQAWQDELTKAKRIIESVAKDEGVLLSPEQLNQLARRYYYSEWQENPDALVSWMQQRAKDPNQQLVGTGSGTGTGTGTSTPLTPAGRQAKINELRDLAEAYGLSFDAGFYEEWARKILDPMVNTNKSEDAKFLQYLVNESRSKYGAYADQLDENTNLRQLSGSYMQSLSRLLEVNPGDLSLDESKMDPLLRRALTNINRETGKPERIPLWEFEQMVRKDDRWQLTDNARATYMDAGTNFLRAFGFVG